MTFVTKPFLPPLEEVTPFLEEIWRSGVLSNGGQYHQKFENELAEFLGVSHVSLFCNATLALITAQQALRLTGEIITTPYSFVATSHAINWVGNSPIFVDIDPVSLTLDPERIEEAITPATTAIMPVHCYGNTSDVEAIQSIAHKYGLRIIYDACHSFGVRDDGGSVLRYGDISAVSFHATKVFNTFEGGILVLPNAEVKQRVDSLKNFGFENETAVIELGINGKMSEFNAAVGLVQLRHFEKVILARGERDLLYRERLQDASGISCLTPVRQVERNYCYFPIFVDTEYPLSRDELYERLQQNEIFTRRYFYPLISEFAMYRSSPSARAENLPIAADVSRKVICLPIYPDLPKSELHKICDLILEPLE